MSLHMCTSAFIRSATTVAAIVVSLVGATEGAAQTSCANEPLAVQILGSGGPFAGDSRASTSYLVWRNGRAIVMVDAGGGSFTRFGESGAKLQDLSLLAVSHVHPDHVSDLPALLWLSEQVRQAPLRVAGPTGNGPFPAIDAFLRRLFDAGTGAFPALAGTLGQPGGGVRLDVVTIDAAAGSAVPVLSDGDLDVHAMSVPHANTPSIAYRVRAGGRTIVFSSDQNGSDPRFVGFAAGADVLVMHLAVSPAAQTPVTQLHATPAVVGQVARDAKVRRLVLSHLSKAPESISTARWSSLSDVDGSVADVRKLYSGPIDTATDLQCIPVR
jgi:ribonuclease BN (tRNA processing enzyme)